MVELVQTTTVDGIRLDGCLLPPERSDSESAASIDAMVMLHGVGGNFYGGSMFTQLATALSKLGVVTLRVNTRGHDTVSMAVTGDGAKWQGAAFEVVDDCRRDIAAWIEWLGARGCQRIGLVGHSLGALKAVYAAAHAPLPVLAMILAVSPPRLSYRAFRNCPRNVEFLQSMATAEQHIQEGRPDALFVARFPLPMLICAAGYIDKYGSQERYNLLRFVDRVDCPMLFVYGEQELTEGGVAFAGLPEAILEKRRDDQQLCIEVVPGADHFYRGAYEQLTAVITHWVTQRAVT